MTDLSYEQVLEMPTHYRKNYIKRVHEIKREETQGAKDEYRKNQAQANKIKSKNKVSRPPALSRGNSLSIR